jgi:hypothetical protein
MNVIDEANRWAALYTPWRRSTRWWLDGCGTTAIMGRSGKSKPVVWRWQ